MKRWSKTIIAALAAIGLVALFWALTTEDPYMDVSVDRRPASVYQDNADFSEIEFKKINEADKTTDRDTNGGSSATGE